MNNELNTIDLDFQGLHEAIPVFFFPNGKKIFLVECGPGSTLATLERKLKAFGYSLDDITDVFVTHIHLDHAGAAGALARRGARIYVHPAGAPHLIDPEKLIASAQKIYGDKMQTLWGDFLAVPEKSLSILQDGDVVKIGDFEVKAVHTPGHANHHITYVINDMGFTGDVGGSRMPGQKLISLPMPPPEFHLETWQQTIDKIRGLHLKKIVVTHFGGFDDVDWHLDKLHERLTEVDAWLQEVMAADPPLEEVHRRYLLWMQSLYESYGLSEEIRKQYEGGSPSWMSPAGLFRYWNKYRRVDNSPTDSKK